MKLIEEKVYCKKCNRKTNHCVLEKDNILLQHTISSNDFKDVDFGFVENFYIVKCNGCDNISFLKEYGDEDQWEYDNHGDRHWYYSYTVYPEEPINTEDFHQIKKLYKVPKFIKELYKEVVDSYNGKSLILCCVGLRMIIEGICKSQGIDKVGLTNRDGTPKLDNATGEVKYRFLGLEEKINILLEKGLITQTQSRVLHQIREMGNQTAHEIAKQDRSIIKASLEILENQLFNIYELATIELFNRD